MKRTNEFIIYTGCMFAGKTTALVNEYVKAEKEGANVICVKPALDTRYGIDEIVTHDGVKVPAKPIGNLQDLKGLTADIILVDEVQFFPIGITSIIQKWLREGRTVIAAGLDLDYRGLPFENMERLLPYATDVFKLMATCDLCGDVAKRSIRTSGSTNVVELGASDKYKAVCLRCFNERQAAN